MFRMIAAGIAALAALPLLAQATGPQGLAEPKIHGAAPAASDAAPLADPANIINIQLSTGGIVSVLLRPDKAPMAVERLKVLAARHFYDGLTFHRVIEGFMAQGGDPKGTGQGGSDLPDLKAEFNDLPHVRGTMAMARASSPDSANSQFYLMLSPNLSLDEHYTAVGRVIRGMAYVDLIEKGEPPAHPTRMVHVYFGEPPANPATPAVADLVPPAPPSAPVSLAPRRPEGTPAGEQEAARAPLMRVDLFDFELPPERIALRPASPRDAARLLVLERACTDDRAIVDLPGLLRAGDWLVFNDTRVIPAQLEGRRGEARIGATLHKRTGPRTWAAFVRNARRVREGDRIVFGEDVAAVASARQADGTLLLSFEGDAPVEELLGRAGRMPLPPYIAGRRPADPRDADDYQTMFASTPGAVAAPTAALHFTPALMAALAARGIEHATLTLHVGAGTFLPVKADDTTDHAMHAEWGRIDAETAARLNAVRAAGGRLIAVGTTSLRLIESAAADDGTICPFEGDTAIFITPGYRFRAIDGLLTNFHLPRSTLFMLVSALMGRERMQAAYAHAIEQGYRFYSYGDASLLLPA